MTPENQGHQSQYSEACFLSSPTLISSKTPHENLGEKLIESLLKQQYDTTMVVDFLLNW
jgi:hypothetical protein